MQECETLEEFLNKLKNLIVLEEFYFYKYIKIKKL